VYNSENPDSITSASGLLTKMYRKVHKMADNNSTSKSFYVYVHRRDTDGRVFYVGKGTANRAWQKASKRNEHWKRIVDKHGLIVEIVESGYQDWYSMEREIQLIEFYGFDNLCNQTHGGEGGGSRVWSDESRKKLSDSKKGKPNPGISGDKNHMKTQASRDKISALFKGKPHPWALGDKNHMKQQKYKDAVGLRYKGKKRPEITGANSKISKPVLCIENGIIFPSGADAARWLNENGCLSAVPSNISSACSGKLKSAYKFTWKLA